jgi:hypothetical protein
VACHEPEERKYIIDQIISQFPQFRKTKVEHAVESACLTLPTPRIRPEFFTCVETKLNDDSLRKVAGNNKHKIQ